MPSKIEIENEHLGSSHYEILGYVNSIGFKRNTDATASEGKYREGNESEFDLTDVHRGQAQNPTYKITGYIDRIGNMPNGEIGYSELLKLYRARNKSCYLRITFDGANTPSGGWQLLDYYGNRKLKGIKCEIDNIKINIPNASQNLQQHIIQYQINLVEDVNDT